MNGNYYDRYALYRKNGGVGLLPGITLEPASTDKTVTYKKGETRLDNVSQRYYNNPYHGFLILARNPQYGGLEFDIPDGTVIAVPFPFNETLERYENKILKHIELYGE